MKKTLLLILAVIFLSGCQDNEYNYLIVTKIELGPFATAELDNGLTYKYKVSFDHGASLLTNRAYQIGDTLK